MLKQTNYIIYNISHYLIYFKQFMKQHNKLIESRSTLNYDWRIIAFFRASEQSSAQLLHFVIYHEVLSSEARLHSSLDTQAAQ